MRPLASSSTVHLPWFLLSVPQALCNAPYMNALSESKIIQRSSLEDGLFWDVMPRTNMPLAAPLTMMHMLVAGFVQCLLTPTRLRVDYISINQEEPILRSYIDIAQ